GTVVLAPRRHVARWRDLSEDERHAVLAPLTTAQDRLETGKGPAEVGFDETSGHFRIVVSPAREPQAAANQGPPASNDAGAGGHAGGAALIAGPENPLHRDLVPLVDRAEAIDVAISFVLASGARLLAPHLQDMLDRGGRLRLLTGDYLDVTEPDALRLLGDLTGDRELRLFEAGATAFHLKSWLFRFDDGTRAVVVGSSNLSRSALSEGVEWNLRLFGGADAPALADAEARFEALFADPAAAPLTDDLIARYEARRRALPPPRPQATGVAPEPVEAPPEPHEVQAEALAALARSRALGHRAGLVVLATGLGKTFLAAFDSRAFPRVLFVAHREEILAQARAAFRRVCPEARLGRFDGAEKDLEADVLLASVQALSRRGALERFAPDAFDYVVVDEFHHAAASTYRRVIDRFEPRFLLGLTATPERADGGDLLGLCQENLVHRCDLWDGIGRGLLSPFAYWGVPDPVDYVQIPWRSARFDEVALTEAVATEARAKNALEQLAARGGSRAIGFCVSVRHADYMASFATANGWRAAAVHSGPGSAPRASALKALEAGKLDVVFAVDMFNEGVDVPSIDTVLMLRPTDSPVVWLQQLGRGLRRAEGKDRLAVVDYIGNHRMFLAKARALLQAGEGDRALAERLDLIRRGELELPPGCEVTYELEALDLLEGLLRRSGGADAAELEVFFRDFELRHGVRPTALEAHHAGFDPRRTGDAGWFAFVARMGGLEPEEIVAATAHRALLREIERATAGSASRTLALRAMIDEGGFPGAVALDRLAARAARLAGRSAGLKGNLGGGHDDAAAMRRRLEREALPAWAEAEGGRWFALDDGRFRTTFALPLEEGEALARLASELLDWRLALHLEGGRAFPRSNLSRPRGRPSPPATSSAPSGGGSIGGRRSPRSSAPPSTPAPGRSASSPWSRRG
ncbi:MAG: DEAD/DEAH box helicase family protein, partial [Pseudomonadota bacterium]